MVCPAGDATVSLFEITITSVMTIVGGWVVYEAGAVSALAEQKR
jgi:hypothetical protein